LRFYHQNFLVFTMIGWVGVKDLRFGNTFTISENFSSVFSVIFVVYSITFPILTYIVY
jgi:hypothetical protein